MQQLSGAKNLEDAVKIQTEFVKGQMETFNQRAKELGEIYTKLATAATKTPSGMSTATATPTHACTATIGLTGATGIGITNKLMAKVITHQSTDW